jgi:flagellar biosynthesis chaperone FliJ
VAQFHFSLEKVLRWRSLELASEGAKLERLLREQLRLQTLRADLSAEKSKLDRSLDTLADLRGADLRAVSAFTLHLKRQAENLVQLVAKCERELSEQKNKYRAAKQKFRLLEELRARKFEEWRQEQARQQETLATESYLAIWNRER